MNLNTKGSDEMTREELGAMLVKAETLMALERTYHEMNDKEREFIPRVEVWNRSTLTIVPGTDTFDSFREWLGSEIETIKAELGITK